MSMKAKNKSQEDLRDLKAKVKLQKQLDRMNVVKAGAVNETFRDKKMKTPKKKKEKFNWKLFFYEFPVKMVKDVTRIKWVTKGRLGKLFLGVLIFIACFAVAYGILDLILTQLFGLAHIIT